MAMEIWKVLILGWGNMELVSHLSVDVHSIFREINFKDEYFMFIFRISCYNSPQVQS